MALDGGKYYLANQIVALMRPHIHYIEPYGGGLAVLLARDPLDSRLWLPGHKGVSEVVCDLEEDLINFWQILADERHFLALRLLCEATPFSQQTWEWCFKLLATHADLSPVQRAWAFFVCCRQSLAGRMKSFTGITKTRTRATMNNEVSAWLSSLDGLQEVHARLKRVLILKPQPAIDVIRAHDSPTSLAYLDPPYLDTTRTSPQVYTHEMTFQDHEELLEVCLAATGSIMISGYANELYDQRLASWSRHVFSVPNQASSSATKRIMEEILWTNY